MSNSITEKYFEHDDFAPREKEVLELIKAKTHFQPEEEIFRGKIYDKNKVASLIYKGFWQQRPAVLKIQGIQPEIDEIDIINRFNDQNQSKIIRLPHLYDGLHWNENDGYGYLILEYVDAPPIYKPPFANQDQIKNFCAVYQEYKTNCLRKSFIKQQPNETSSLVFTAERVTHWAKIAQSKGYLSAADIKDVERFLTLAGQHLPSIKMDFMHGHFSCDDIFKLSDDEYVLMSNLFWSYRPEFYDTTFHLWAGIKSLRDQNVEVKQIIKYLQSWIEEYKKLPIIKHDSDFERKFAIMITERCLGALLVDIRNQDYKNNRNDSITHLTKLFKGLFNHFTDQL